MNKKLTTTSLFIGLIILISVIGGCINKNSNLKFSTGTCYSNTDPYSQPQEGILNQTWNNQNILIVEGYVKTFCDGATIIGDYTLSENNLILKYKIETAESVSKCNCAHKVIYQISNLEKKDYFISIISE